MTKSRGICKPHHKYTPEEDEAIRTRYPHERTDNLARDLGLTNQQTYRRAASLGLSKTPEYLASPDACRLRRDCSCGIPFRFPKGHIPANKGMRRPGWAPGRMAETQFKKGRKPEESRNYVPIGSYRITRDGFLEQKVTDDPTLYPARRWVGVHRLIWETAHGPIPKGHVVRFKSGTKTTNPEEITIDKLEMITLAENMKRNTIHNYPKEIVQVTQLRGAINRKINRMEKNNGTTKE